MKPWLACWAHIGYICHVRKLKPKMSLISLLKDFIFYYFERACIKDLKKSNKYESFIESTVLLFFLYYFYYFCVCLCVCIHIHICEYMHMHISYWFYLPDWTLADTAIRDRICIANRRKWDKWGHDLRVIGNQKYGWCGQSLAVSVR